VYCMVHGTRGQYSAGEDDCEGTVTGALVQGARRPLPVLGTGALNLRTDLP